MFQLPIFFYLFTDPIAELASTESESDSEVRLVQPAVDTTASRRSLTVAFGADNGRSFQSLHLSV